MVELLVQRDRLGQISQLTVHPRTSETFALRFLEHLSVLTLAPLHHRCGDHQPRALGQLQYLVGYLLDRLLADLAPAVGAVGVPDACIEQAQVVIDLRYGPDSRARVLARSLLVDGDGRAEPGDVVDIRLLHLPEKLARIRAQRLDVAPLPFRVDRVERERRLAASPQPSDDDQPIARQHKVNILEVVLARTVYDDLIGGHQPVSVPSRRPRPTSA